VTSLTDQHLKDVLLVTRVALGCSHIDELRKVVLSHLETIFDCDKCDFYLSRGQNNELDWENGVSRGLELENLLEYAQYFCQLDPHLQGIALGLPAFVTEQIVPFQHFVNSEFYNDFFKQHSIHYQLTMSLLSGKSLLGALSFMRPKNATNFSSQDIFKAQLISSHLSRIVAKYILFERTTRQVDLLKSVVMDLPHTGILVLDESLEPTYIDENADKIISSLCQQGKREHGATLCLPKELQQCCDDLISSCRSEEHAEGYQRLTLEIGKAGKQLPVLVRLVTHRNRPTGFIVHLYPKDNILSSLRKYGLTQREVEVSSRVTEGLKNSEIAEKLFISEYTVETHLKSIYKKMGVKNRTTLAYRVLEITSTNNGIFHSSLPN